MWGGRTPESGADSNGCVTGCAGEGSGRGTGGHHHGQPKISKYNWEVQWPLFMGLIYAKRGSIVTGRGFETYCVETLYVLCSNPLITVWYSAINSDSHHV